MVFSWWVIRNLDKRRCHLLAHPNCQFSHDLTVEATADRGQYKIIAYVLAMLCHI
jgi:hypothetical protein